MTNNLKSIVNMIIGNKCLTERKDEYNQINTSKNNYIHIRLHDLKDAENFNARIMILNSLKPYMETNEDLLQYYNALSNTVHMDAINQSIKSIFSTCDLIYDQMLAVSLMRGYQAEYYEVQSPGRYKAFVKDVTENIERTKSIISRLYPKDMIKTYAENQLKWLGNIFKRENAYNIVIEQLIDSVNNEVDRLLKYKKSLIENSTLMVKK